jgi:hypothetical protein
MIHPSQTNVPPPRTGPQGMAYQNPYFPHDYPMNPPPQPNLPYPNSQAPYYPPPYDLYNAYQQPNNTYGNPPPPYNPNDPVFYLFSFFLFVFFFFAYILEATPDVILFVQFESFLCLIFLKNFEKNTIFFRSN